MKQFFPLLLLGLSALSASAQTELTTSEAEKMSASASYKEVGIHDPSIVYNPAENNFYIVGTHRGWAKTSDLLNLTSLNSNNIYTSGYSTQFKSCPEHEVKVSRNGEIVTATLPSFDAGAFCATYAGIKVGDREPTTEANWISGDLWAPDLIYNPNMQKWCMYLSLNGDNWASVIVLLTADSPAGPFKYEAPIVCGGFNGQKYSGVGVDYKKTDLEIVLGEQESLPSRYKTSAWGNLWPNCIDPCVFFDDDSNLWMAYGSWSGGIFLLRLDAQTGLRDYTYTYESKTYSGTAPNRASYTGYLSDPYFGKLIAGGAYVSGEGPYIQKIGDYYYLFVTYGGLNPDAGYEMRVFRSATPDGNYVDATGANARYTQYQLNFGPNAVTNKGMKLLGAMNNWGTMTTGECAEGHNSAVVDPDGDAFLVYHTKFNDGSYGFQVRTRQLFTNERGWLVASPFRFTGKQTRQADIDSKQLFTPEEIAGTYDLIYHPYRLNHNNMAQSIPMKVTLTADGKVEGTRTGTWEYSEDEKSYVKIVLNDVSYFGVALNQNVDGYVDMPALCFSAVSNTGVPVWLYKHTPKATVALAHKNVVKKYIGSDKNMIKEDAPTVDNAEVVFDVVNAASGEPEPETLSPQGIFTKTADGHEISINVAISSGNYFLNAGPFTRATMSVDYVETVPEYYPESTKKNLTSGWWSNFSEENYILELGKSAKFHFVNYSDCKDNWHNWALYGASATHGASGYTEYFGIRCDNWDNTTGSNTGCSSNFNWDTFKTDMDGSTVDMTVSYSTDGIFTMNAEIVCKNGSSYTYSYEKSISGAPEKITLFFVSEASYISGEDAISAVDLNPADNSPVSDGKTYNIFGIEVDDTYKGIVIKNGKKSIQ